MKREIGRVLVLMTLAISVRETQAEADLRVVARLGEDHFAGSSGGLLAFSPDGKLLANAAFSIGIWDVATGNRVAKMDGHSTPQSQDFFRSRAVSGIAFSHDGKTLISTGGDGAIRIWEVATGTLQREILVPWLWVDGVSRKERVIGRIPLYGMALTPDSKRLAVTAHGGSVHLWNLETGEQEWAFGKGVAEKVDPDRFEATQSINFKEVWKLSENSRVSYSLPLLSPDGRFLAVTGYDSVEVWGLTDRKSKFKTDTGGAAAYSPDGRSLVTGRYEELTVWDALTGKRTGGFTDAVKIFVPLCFSPDGRLITGSDGASGIRVWDFPSGRLLKTLMYGSRGLLDVAVSPDGSLLAATVDRSRLHLWDLRTGRLQFDGGHSSAVRVLQFSPDGRYLVSGGYDASLRVWETERWTLQCSLVQPEMYVSALEFLPGGNHILVGDRVGTSRRISFPALDIDESFKHEKGIAGYVVRDDQLFVAVDKNPGTLETWDLAPPRRIASRQQHRTYGMRIASTHEQNLVASGDYDGNVVVWRDNPDKSVASFHADGSHIEAIAFSPDGKRLATICWNNSVPGPVLEIRDSFQWNVLTRMRVGGSGITSVDWSPDGKTLAIAAMGRPSNLYFVTQNRLESVEVPETVFESLCFSRDGKYLAGGDRQGGITIWSFGSRN